LPTPGYWIECSRQQITTDTIYDESESDREGTDIDQQAEQLQQELEQPLSIGNNAMRHSNRQEQDCLFEENELDGDESPKKKTVIEEQWEKSQV
jgi:RAP1 GTPase activating protein 1